MKTVDFWTPKGKYGFLSNFYSAPMTIDGKVYETNEHFFQSQKFVGKPEEDYIIALPTPGDTAKEGKRRDFPLRSDWENIKEDVMLKGLTAKFEQHPVLRQKLLETKGLALRETSPYDKYWGTGRDMKGQNRLGVLLEKVRDEMIEREDINQ